MDTPRGGAGIMDAVLERISEYLSTAANPRQCASPARGLLILTEGSLLKQMKI
ncbi:MAG: hypothetical protein ACLSCO_03400 [Gallintestinimicrobium sp.]